MATRRVRCFFCRELVIPTPSTTETFAAHILKIQNHLGCICSECVQDLYCEFEDFFEEDDNSFAKNGLHYSTNVGKIGNVTTYTVTAQQGNTSDSPIDDYPSLSYSLESYIKLAKSKVFGQDEAVEKTAYTVYHNQFCNMLDDLGNESPEHENMLLIGPTGSGKTYTAETVLRIMNIPFIRIHADSLTSSGYIGDDVKNILVDLYKSANSDIEKAQKGVVIIDEIDKKRHIPGNGRDVSGLSVQQELLKILEPSVIWLEIKQSSHQVLTIPFDTSNLTIILCGAFTGLSEIIENRLFKKKIGFTNEQKSTEDILSLVEPIDIINYGFVDEFVGRIPSPMVLKPLSKETLLDIAYAELEKQLSLFHAFGCELCVDENVLNTIVDIAALHKTGARDIKKEIRKLLYKAKRALFANAAGGICEIDRSGNTTILRTAKTTGKTELLEFPGAKNLRFSEE